MNTILKRIENRDIAILKVINNSLRCKTLDFVMPPITYLGSVLFSIVFCIITILHSNETIHDLGVKSCIALAFSSAVTQLIKTSVNRIRPFLKISNLNIKKIGIDEYSFPSGHTTAAFSMAITTALFYPSIAIVSIVLACSVGISRMYLGVHYPTDVLAGSFLGTLSSILVYLFT
ncbi:phosphatase PAP2 family protein [Clostridium ganghwense]|uniref:Phosphatase PAP2 family protein n=1 Tax=Clostridium ganghwense TaxID=312089 RepID=A0ABT4CV99_9CLOT|nr:phosphatase PAP2 family protein [Clostridium ganghwense]MCY6371986.1 phosphatase PAP2 family protein [Clostridium ganghwense]